jgi:hypothetical protein
MLKMDRTQFYQHAEQQINWKSIQPIENKIESKWIGLNDQRELIEINMVKNTLRIISSLVFTNLDWDDKITMIISSRGEYAAIANTRAKFGVVVDLLNGQITMELNRGDYDTGNQNSNFSLAFFSKNDRDLLIHATDWNRLDVSDPATGENLTIRNSPKSGEKHYWDYFHASLQVSPDQKCVIDNGWVWHPYAALTSWDLNQWLEDNVWASEVMKSDLPGFEGVGDRPLCWVDNQTFAVWGMEELEGEEGDRHSEFYSDLGIYDISTGEIKKKIVDFPEGELIFDTYLFSFSEDHGMAVYDIKTDEKIFEDENFKPLAYSKARKEFLSLLVDGSLEINLFSEI